MRMRLALTAMLLVILAPMAARAQPLAKQMPADTLIYFGWQGSTAAGAAYDNSNLKGMLDASGLREQITALISQAIERAGQQDAKKAEQAKLLKSTFEELWKFPAAIYFGGVDFSNADQPQPRLALVAAAGKDAPALAEKINKLLADRPEADRKVPAAAKVAGDYLVLSIGETKALEAQLAGDPARSLAADPQFLAAAAQVDKDPVAFVYANGEALVQLLDQAVTRAPDANAKTMWPRVKDALGIDALKRIAASGNFDGKNWNTRAFIQMGKLRTGLLGLLDAKPLADDALKLIPKNAAWAGAARFDGARLLNEIRDAAGRAGEAPQKQFDFWLDNLTLTLGVDLRKDVLESLGDAWLYYSVPDAAGNSVPGITLLNRPRDPKRLDESVQTLVEFANSTVLNRMGDNAPVSLKGEKTGDVTMYTLSFPGGGLAMAIQNGTLAIAANPQRVQAALARQESSILDNPDFVALRQRMGAAPFSGFSFADLPKTAREAYGLLLKLQARGAADDPSRPQVTLPPVEKIMPFMNPAASIYWTDESGWHARSHEPFPGASLFGAGQALMETLSLNMPRPPGGPGRPGRTGGRAAGPLGQVGAAVKTYTSAHDGEFPPDLGTLVASGALPAQAVTGQPMPADIQAKPAADQAAWVNANSRFEYTAGGKRMTHLANPATSPIAHEKLSAGTGPVMVLYGDGHTARITREEAEALFK